MGALSGIRVIDFGQYVAGPLLGMMLADNGADVIRIDPPGGPRWDNPVNAMLHRGKRSIVLDLKTEEGRAAAKELIRKSDIVIENFRPGVMQRLGIGPDEMITAAPQLIYCSLPGFASSDPRSQMAGWDIIVGAATGLYNAPNDAGYFHSTDAPDADEPLFSVVPSPSVVAAISAAIAVMAALHARHRDGRGQKIEVPLFNAMFEIIGVNGTRLDPAPDVPDYIHPASILLAKASDSRFFHMAMPEDWHFRRVADAIFPASWRDEGMFDPENVRRDYDLAFELRRRLFDLFRTRPAQEWVDLFTRLRVPCSTCQSTEEWLHSEHAIASRAVIAVEDPFYGRTHQAGFPAILSKSPPDVAGPRHELDQDRAAILADIAGSRQVEAISDKAPQAALAGVRVVDITEILAGPVAGRILAEYGAEVIKINRPDGQHIAHCATNGGKQSILLDLKKPEAREIMRRLLADADVFVQNFARGVMETLHLGDADLRAINPEIINASLSAFGYEGPLGGGRGYEPHGQALTGISDRFGDPGEPIRTKLAICDYGTGLLGAFGVLLALVHRQRTGEGQKVNASLAQTGTYQQLPFMFSHVGKERHDPGGQHLKGLHPLYRIYRAEDGWFAIALPDSSQQSRQQLSTALGIDGREFEETEDLEGALSRLFGSAQAETWVSRLVEGGVAAHPICELEDVMEDSWVRSQGLSVEREHENIGRMRMPGPSARLSRTPAIIGDAARLPGSDTRAVLARAGLGNWIDSYIRQGVVSDHPKPGKFHA